MVEKEDKSQEKNSSSKRIIIDFSGSEIIERTATGFGTGAHVIVPKEYAGKKVKIIFDNSLDEKDTKGGKNEKK